MKNEVLVPSSSEERPGRKQPLGASSLRCVQLSPRRTQAHRGELGTEYSTSHTIPMHLTKRNPALNLSHSEPLFSQPRPTSTHGLVSTSVAVEETSQERTFPRRSPHYFPPRNCRLRTHEWTRPWSGPIVTSHSFLLTSLLRHPHLVPSRPHSLTNGQVVAELGWTRKAIKDFTGVTPILFRPLTVISMIVSVQPLRQ